MTCPEDLDRVSCLLRAVTSDAYARIVTVEGPPAAKPRPRVGRGRFYNPASPAEAALAWRLKAVFREPLDGNLTVICLFFRQNRQRVDVDNLLKFVMDAANKIVWADDSQVTAQVGILELDAARPRTVIAVAQHASSLTRGKRWTLAPVVQEAQT